MVNESQVRAAIRANEQKLQRQLQAIEATKGMLDLLTQQLNQLLNQQLDATLAKPGPKK